MQARPPMVPGNPLAAPPAWPWRPAAGTAPRGDTFPAPGASAPPAAVAVVQRDPSAGKVAAVAAAELPPPRSPEGPGAVAPPPVAVEPRTVEASPAAVSLDVEVAAVPRPPASAAVSHRTVARWSEGAEAPALPALAAAPAPPKAPRRPCSSSRSGSSPRSPGHTRGRSPLPPHPFSRRKLVRFTSTWALTYRPARLFPR